MFHQLLYIAMLSQEPQNDVQALIQEVRTLRSALDRTTFVGLRVQLVLHRLGQQQNVVANAQGIAARLESELSWAKSRRDQLEREVASFEQMKRTTKPEEAVALERQAKWIRAEYEAFPKKIQETETSCLEAKQNLRTEQAKLEDLNRQLDELEKRLAEISPR